MLRTHINTCPIIDNHAHNLLPGQSSEDDLLSVTSEASGPAIRHAKTSLAHLRATRHLSELLGCKNSWDAVVHARSQQSEEALARMCLGGIQTILMDDGLPEECHPYDWHTQFVRSPVRRIVRIEVLAERIMKEICNTETGKIDKSEFTEKFKAAIEKALSDNDVVGFKSVICYRSGLDIDFEADPDEIVYEERIENKATNDYIVNLVAAALKPRQIFGRPGYIKPIQFHTGLGDNDITLTKSSPAHLQRFIKYNPSVRIVLLHSSYPFVREAGYLASVYENVYLDFGEVFPMVSRDGQEDIVRQVLELTPSSKLMWSTDGHYWPETYYLAIKQVREALVTVLEDMVLKGDLTDSQAVNLVTDVLYQTANECYALGLPLHAPPEQTTLTTRVHESSKTKYVRVTWTDYTATVRCRILTRKFFNETTTRITKACLFLLQNDWPVPGSSPSGEYLLNTGDTYSHPRPGHITTFCTMSPATLCPKSILQRALDSAKKDFKIGFEIEFVILDQKSLDKGDIAPISDAHCWSSTRTLLPAAMDILEEIVDEITTAGIEVLHFHPESSRGQYELVTGPGAPMQAVEKLLHTREIITTVCARYGYRATLLPKPYPHEAGTAAHMHVSCKDDKRFIAGVLEYLPQVMMFTLGGQASYERLQQGCWAGGLYSCWGRLNKEAPARLVSEDDGHWELKTIDGLANPYLLVAAVITAGMLGIEKNLKLTEESEGDASNLSSEERQRRGYTSLPLDWESCAVKLLERPDFVEKFGRPAAEHMLAARKAEASLLDTLFPGENNAAKKGIWLAQRY